MRPEGWRGKLLVASPKLSDANFLRTVVLLLAHSDEGALGVVLNRPSPSPLEDHLPSWAPLAAPPKVVFFGGPVARGSVIALARPADAALASELTEVIAGIRAVDLSGDADSAPVEAVRVFSGHAGWGPGQLEAEVDAGAWIVVPAEGSEPLSSRPETLWRDVLRRQGGTTAMLASYPSDLRWN